MSGRVFTPTLPGAALAMPGAALARPYAAFARRCAAIALLCAALAALLACGPSGKHPSAAAAPDGARVVNLYTWADYMSPDTPAAFERATGVKLRVTYFDNNESLESRMLTGHSDFDVVVPTASFIKRQIRSGAYQRLDKARLPNIAALDPALVQRVAVNDPGNAYGVIYTWGTIGIGYNEKLVAARLGAAPPESWRLLFDPVLASKLQSCGINLIDDPAAIVQIVLKYLGKDPNAPTAEDFDAVEKVLLRIRPYIRNIDTTTEIEAMANGDICVSLAYSGDFVQARKRAREAHNGIELGYLMPEEGSVIWFDLLAIPRDAPHLDNAYRLINYMMDPAVIAKRTNAIGFANANLQATPLLDPAVAADPAIYPSTEQRQRLFLSTEVAPADARTITRLWQRFKTAQ